MELVRHSLICKKKDLWKIQFHAWSEASDKRKKKKNPRQVEYGIFEMKNKLDWFYQAVKQSGIFLCHELNGQIPRYE